ncbi:MAG: HAMP domain-containing histidine kinase, partial [Bacteroidales bacterium]|nr:HAMP domain-containing histidine kinase [Bacteroidales bacterium]
MFEILRNACRETVMTKANGQEKQNKMITRPDILEGVSHEVRTQMNSIVAFSYLINNERFSDNEKREFSEQIITSCEQLIGLFENFFDTAALETGTARENLRETDITKLFETLASDFRVFMRKKGNDNVVLIQEDNLPEKLMLKLDATRASRVVSNLFRNAFDNTFSGFIKVGCTYSDDTITFSVKDSGQDFSRSSDLLLSDNPEIQHSESQDTYSAMNLILARNLILAMEGKIRVEPN